MAIDITNNCIGIALAYHRQHDVPNREVSSQQIAESENNTDDNNSTTSIVALPPIPYLSSDPYHPSYAFLHHHRQESSNNVRGLDRVERTLEIADQLAQLAIDRQVRGILVRWPGDLASTVSLGEKENEQTSQVEEGDLLLPNIQENNIAGNTKKLADGSMGYMRGRILYVLDKCCTSHGHAKTNNTLEPLLIEGNRPFALWDTSISESNWISYEQEFRNSTKSKNKQPRIPKRQDKYGNSLTEMDLFGRAAIFGSQPPDPQQGKHRFSSKQQYSGYRVSTQFGSVAKNEMSKSQQSLNENFDSFDIESRMNQFQGSLSAMHSLYDFVTEHLQGRVILPTWASSSSVSSGRAKSQVLNGGLFAEKNKNTTIASQSKEESRKTEAALGKTASSTIIAKKQPNGLASLVQIPKRKGRRREKRG